MVKRNIGILFLILVFMFVITGCEDAKVYTYEDFVGHWDLADSSEVSIMIDDTDPNPITLDLKWLDGTYKYSAWTGGSADGSVLAEAYTYQKTDSVDNIIVLYGSTEPEIRVTITLTMYQDKPKLTCTGDGPLAGKVFSM